MGLQNKQYFVCLIGLYLQVCIASLQHYIHSYCPYFELEIAPNWIKGLAALCTKRPSLRLRTQVNAPAPIQVELCLTTDLKNIFFQAKGVSSSTNLTGHPALQLLPQPSLVVPPPPKALVMLLTRRVTCNKPPPLQAEAGSPHNKPVSTIPVVVPMQVKNPRTYFFKIQITKIPTPSKATPPPLIQS